MPQFNHFETKSGQQIDPTFGLNALSEETKRKTKAREQMNIAANVIRQSLAADGKGLTKGTEVNIEEGGQYTFTGDNAVKDETNLYNIRKANYGKTGTGNISKTYEVQDGAQQKAMDFVSGANQQQRSLMDVVAKKAASVAAGSSPAVTLPDGTSIPAGTSVRSGASNEASIDAGSATSSGQTLLQKNTDRSVRVDDDLQMNQSDLAVASAMEALNSQVYGTTNPGIYQKLMEQNKATSAAKNAANILEDHSSEQVAGRQFNQHQDFGKAQFGQRKDSSAGGGVTPKKDKPVGYYTTREGATGEFELSEDRTKVYVPGGSPTDFVNTDKLTQLSDRLDKGEKPINAMYNMYNSTKLGELKPVIIPKAQTKSKSSDELFLYDGKVPYAKVMFDATNSTNVDADGNIVFNGKKDTKTGRYLRDDKGIISGIPGVRIVYLTNGKEEDTGLGNHSIQRFNYASGQQIRVK